MFRYFFFSLLSWSGCVRYVTTGEDIFHIILTFPIFLTTSSQVIHTFRHMSGNPNGGYLKSAKVSVPSAKPWGSGVAPSILSIIGDTDQQPDLINVKFSAIWCPKSPPPSIHLLFRLASVKAGASYKISKYTTAGSQSETSEISVRSHFTLLRGYLNESITICKEVSFIL